MNKEDWIILRLLFAAARSTDKKAFTDPDVARSVLYLIKKYGESNVHGYINQLKERA